MIVTDLLGIPIKVGDTVLYSVSGDKSMYSGVNTCQHFSCEVLEIDDFEWAVGKYNHKLIVAVPEYSNQTRIELFKEASGSESRYARNPKEAKKFLEESSFEKQSIMSNDVMNITEIETLAQQEYAEYFV